MSSTDLAKGRITQVIGPAVDVEFPQRPASCHLVCTSRQQSID